jgi:hypothetical protein
VCELAVFGLPEHAVATLHRLQRLTAIHTPQQQHRVSTAAYHAGGGGSSSSSAAYQQQLVPTVTSVAVRAPVKSQEELDEMFDKVSLLQYCTQYNTCVPVRVCRVSVQSTPKCCHVWLMHSVTALLSSSC